MRITICGSMKFFEKFIELKEKLEKLGHSVFIPELKIEMTERNISISDYLENESLPGEDLTRLRKKKNTAILNHFKEIESSDCILVANYNKKGIEGYIGINTMLEMGLSTYLHKPVYLLNRVPKVDRTDEIYGMIPIIIENDLSKIK